MAAKLNYNTLMNQRNSMANIRNSRGSAAKLNYNTLMTP